MNRICIALLLLALGIPLACGSQNVAPPADGGSLADGGPSDGGPVTPIMTDVNPKGGGNSGGTEVTITGQNFAAGVKVSFGSQEAAGTLRRSTSEIIAYSPKNTKGAVNITVENPGGLSDTMNNIFTYENSSLHWCILQNPQTLTTLSGATTQDISGRVYKAGVTGPGSDGSQIVGQVGYGPDGTDPRTDPNWVFFDAGFSSAQGNNDEYKGRFVAPAAGTYDFAFRFSDDNRRNYQYCDSDGYVHGDPNGYEIAKAGSMTVQ